MAKPILVANWKNHPHSLTETQAILRELARKSTLYKRVALFLAPPLTYLDSVASRASGYARPASQDLNIVNGTQTGAVGIDILKSFGVRLSILGHSERRALGETSENVSLKARLALRHGMVPLICVGEKIRDHDGEYFEFLRDQLKASLSGLNAKMVSGVVLAYEPIWAIGKTAKEAIQHDELAQTILFLRKVLTDLYGRKMAEKIPILYGGSVEPADAGILMRGTGVQGFLVGHASLKGQSLASIAQSLLSK